MPSTADPIVGMMDAAYFVGRRELLDWLNGLLCLRLQKIEQTATGAIACQLVDIMYPNTIPMSKVNWEARNDFEYVQNYKLLQAAFTKQHVARHLPVEKLIKAKYQDNLEFMQWFKAFFEQSGSFREDYDPTAVRLRGKGGRQYNQTLGAGGSASASSRGVVGSRGTNTGAARSSTAPSIGTRPKVGASATSGISSRANNARSAGQQSTALSGSTNSPRATRPLRERPNDVDNDPFVLSKPTVVQDPALIQEIEELRAKNDDLTKISEEYLRKVEEGDLAMLEIEKERDFYFKKLRDIEVMLQVHQEQGIEDPKDLIEKVFTVLYATAEDNVAVDDNGEIVKESTDFVDAEQEALTPMHHQNDELLVDVRPSDESY